MSTESSSSGGIGLAGCVFLIFLVLKLAEVGAIAQWSWWWVTSPLWLPAAVILPIVGCIALWVTVFDWLDRRRKMREMTDD